MRRRFAAVITALLFTLGFVPTAAQASIHPDSMAIVVKIEDTDQDGVLSDLEKRAGVPLQGTVNGVIVDWGDGSVPETFNTPGFKSHVYSAAGEYTVEISLDTGGQLTHWGFTGNPGDRDDGGGDGADGKADDEMAKITQVLQWGNLGITSMDYGFGNAENLVDVPANFPSSVRQANALFIRATSFNDPDIVSWDVSSLDVFRSLFWEATSFNQPIGNWNLSSATDLSFMFSGASSFNQPLSGWDTSNVQDFSAMFQFARAFNQPLGNFTFDSATNPNLLALSTSGISNENLGASIAAWAARTQPTGLNLDVNRAISRNLKPAVDILQNDYGWTTPNLRLEPIRDSSVLIRAARTNSTGFSGLRTFAGPGTILGNVDLGERDNTFDGFGELILIAPDVDSKQLIDSDFQSCTRELDGEQLGPIASQVGSHYTTTCTTFPIEIGGGEITIEATTEIMGSFIRHSAKVVSFSGLTELEIRIGGEMNSSFDTELLRFQDMPRANSLVAYDIDDIADNPVVGFKVDQPFSLRSGQSTSTLTDLSGDDEVYFDVGLKSLSAGAELFNLEMFFVDFDPRFSPDDGDIFLDSALNDAITFASDLLASESYEFGMCLPMVRDGYIPPFIDECERDPGLPLILNFAQWDAEFSEFSDMGLNAVVGDEVLFEEIGFLGDTALNAVVRIDGLVGMLNEELAALDSSVENSRAAEEEWFLRPSKNSAGGEARLELTIRFQDSGGNPVVLPELFVNAYDVDNEKYVEFAAFQDYYLTEDTVLEVSEAPSGWTRFTELDSVSYSDEEVERTKARVMVRYENITSIRLAMGEVLGTAYPMLDFGPGLGWQTLAEPNATTPEPVQNFVDLPALTPPSPAMVTQFSGREVSVCEPTVITLSGDKLSISAASIGGLPVKVLESSGTGATLEIPAGLTPGTRFDLILVGDGTLRVQDALFTSSTLCAQAISVPVWTKKISASEVKFYAKDLVEAGKLQFFANGEEVAWIRAVDETDPKLSFANGSQYFVRTFRLAPGKNALEIFLDGERLWRAAYTLKD